MIDIPPTNYTLQVIIKSPLALVYKGQALAVTLVNEKGTFDILPLHENLVSLIKGTVTIYESREKQKEIKIEEGIAKVFENTVAIFIGMQTIT